MITRYTKMRAALSLIVSALMIATVCDRSQAQQAGARKQSSDLDVVFTDCVESIGVTLAPTASVRGLVPQSFILAGDGQPVTPLVVRTAHCRSISTDGHGQRAGDIVQIGAVVVPPDFTGDINNYTLWYYTNDLRLALRLLEAGVGAQFVPTIDYDTDVEDGTLHVRVPFPGFPRLVLSGGVVPSPQSAGSFVANWWQEVSGHKLKMNTTVPVINIGTADLTLTTNASGPLGQLIGGSSTGFPIIQQFNTFGSAQMRVTTLP